MPNGSAWCYMNTALQLLAALARVSPSLDLSIALPKDGTPAVWQTALSNLLRALAPKDRAQPPNSEVLPLLHDEWVGLAHYLNQDFRANSHEDAGVAAVNIMESLKTPRGISCVVTQRECNQCHIRLVSMDRNTAILLRVPPPAPKKAVVPLNMQTMVNNYFTRPEGGTVGGSNCPSCKFTNAGQRMTASVLQCGNNDSVLLVRFSREYGVNKHSLTPVHGWESFYIPYANGIKVQYHAVAVGLWMDHHWTAYITKLGGHGHTYWVSDTSVQIDVEFPEHLGYSVGVVAYVSDRTGMQALHQAYQEQRNTMQFLWNPKNGVPCPTEALWEYLSRLEQPDHMRIVSPRDLSTMQHLEATAPASGRAMCVRPILPDRWYAEWSERDAETGGDLFDSCEIVSTEFKVCPVAWSILVMLTSNAVKPKDLFRLELHGTMRATPSAYYCWCYYSCLMMQTYCERRDPGGLIMRAMGPDWSWLDYSLRFDRAHTAPGILEGLAITRPLVNSWMHRDLLFLFTKGLSQMLAKHPHPNLGNNARLALNGFQGTPRRVVICHPTHASDLWRLVGDAEALSVELARVHRTNTFVLIPINIGSDEKSTGEHWVFAVVQLRFGNAAVLFVDSLQNYKDIVPDDQSGGWELADTSKVKSLKDIHGRNMEVLLPLYQRLVDVGYRVDLLPGRKQFAYQEDGWACGFHVAWWLLDAVTYFSEEPNPDVSDFSDTRIQPDGENRQHYEFTQDSINQLLSVANHSVDLQQIWVHWGVSVRAFTRTPDGSMLPPDYRSPVGSRLQDSDVQWVPDSDDESVETRKHVKDKTALERVETAAYMRWRAFVNEPSLATRIRWELHTRFGVQYLDVKTAEKPGWRARMQRDRVAMYGGDPDVVNDAEEAKASAPMADKPVDRVEEEDEDGDKDGDDEGDEEGDDEEGDEEGDDEEGDEEDDGTGGRIAVPATKVVLPRARPVLEPYMIDAVNILNPMEWNDRPSLMNVTLGVVGAEHVTPEDLDSVAKLVHGEARLAGVHLRLSRVGLNNKRSGNPPDVVVSVLLAGQRNAEGREHLDTVLESGWVADSTWMVAVLSLPGDEDAPVAMELGRRGDRRAHGDLVFGLQATPQSKRGLFLTRPAGMEEDALVRGLFLRYRLMGLWSNEKFPECLHTYSNRRPSDGWMAKRDAGLEIFTRMASQPPEDMDATFRKQLFSGGEPVSVDPKDPRRRERVNLKFYTLNAQLTQKDLTHAKLVRFAEAMWCNVDQVAVGLKVAGAMRCSVRHMDQADAALLVVEANPYMGRDGLTAEQRQLVLWHEAQVAEALWELGEMGRRGRFVFVLYVWPTPSDKIEFWLPPVWEGATPADIGVMHVANTPTGFVMADPKGDRLVLNFFEAGARALELAKPLAVLPEIPNVPRRRNVRMLPVGWSVVTAPYESDKPIVTADMLLNALRPGELIGNLNARLAGRAPPTYLELVPSGDHYVAPVQIVLTHRLELVGNQATYRLPWHNIKNALDRFRDSGQVFNVVLLNVRNNPAQVALTRVADHYGQPLGTMQGDMQIYYAEVYMDKLGIYRAEQAVPLPIFMHDALPYDDLAYHFSEVCSRIFPKAADEAMEHSDDEWSRESADE